MIKSVDYEQKSGIFMSAASATLVGLAVSLVLPVIFSAILMASGSSTNMIPVLGTLSSAFGALAAGFIFGRKTRRHGMFGGLIVGAAYFLFLIIIGFIISKQFSSVADIIIMALISLFGGMLGGIAGVNIRGGKNKRK